MDGCIAFAQLLRFFRSARFEPFHKLRCFFFVRRLLRPLELRGPGLLLLLKHQGLFVEIIDPLLLRNVALL